MSAFLIVHVTVKDPEKWQAYTQSAPATVAAHGREFAFRGKVAGVLNGEHAHQIGGVIQFPDQEAVQKWYHSPEYQALIPNRDEAADMVFVSLDEPQE